MREPLFVQEDKLSNEYDRIVGARMLRPLFQMPSSVPVTSLRLRIATTGPLIRSRRNVAEGRGGVYYP